MSFRALLAWGVSIWIIAGIEAAMGTGFPGPLFMLTLAAGFSSGSLAGVIVGMLAGLCSVVSGGSFFLSPLIGVALGLTGGLCARYFSRRNLLVAILMGLLFSFVLSMLLQIGTHRALPQVLQFALWRGLFNALWISAIYGIVLVLSTRHSSHTRIRTEWEY